MFNGLRLITLNKLFSFKLIALLHVDVGMVMNTNFYFFLHLFTLIFVSSGNVAIVDVETIRGAHLLL